MKLQIKHVIGIVALIAVLVLINYPSVILRAAQPSGLMSFDEEKTLSKYHDLLLEHYDIDYQILVEENTGDINLFTNKAFEGKRVGSRSETGRGILLVIDKAANKVRMEHSTTLEPIFTDAFTSYIERNQMVPFFKNDQVFMGVIATSELIRNRAEEARQGLEFDDTLLLEQATSIGAGATVEANIGKGQDDAANPAPHILLKAQDTPEATFELYKQAGALGINSLKFTDLNTAASTEKMKDVVITPAQMVNGARLDKKCRGYQLPTRYNLTGDRAVIGHSLENRRCWQFMLEKSKEDGKWRMARDAFGYGLTYTFQNEWWLDDRQREGINVWRYDFGFQHYDMHGKEMRHLPKYPTLGVLFAYGSHGVVVSGIGQGSPMEQFDVKVGDVILAWGGNTLKHILLNYKEPLRLMTDYTLLADNGEHIPVTLMRGGAIIQVMLTAPPKPAFGKTIRWGVSYSKINPQMIHVTHLDENSLLRKVGLQENDMVLAWNGVKIEGYNQIKQLRDSVKAGEKHTITVGRYGMQGMQNIDIDFIVPEKLEGYDDPHWTGKKK